MFLVFMLFSYFSSMICTQGKLQSSLMSLGLFDTVVDEVLAWLDDTSKRLDDTAPLYGDPKLIETELSKLKVEHCHIT